MEKVIANGIIQMTGMLDHVVLSQGSEPSIDHPQSYYAAKNSTRSFIEVA